MNVMLRVEPRKRGRTCQDAASPDLALVEARMRSGAPFSRATLDELRGRPDHDGLVRRAIKRWRTSGLIKLLDQAEGEACWAYVGKDAAPATKSPKPSVRRRKQAPERPSRPAAAVRNASDQWGAYALLNGEIRITTRAVPKAMLLASGPRDRLHTEISRRAPRAFDSPAFAVPGTLWTKDETAIRRAAEVFSWFLNHALDRRFDAPNGAGGHIFGANKMVDVRRRS